MRKHPLVSDLAGGGAGPAGRAASPGYVSTPPLAAPAGPASAGALTAAVQAYMEHVRGSGVGETSKVQRAWELYENPEVRFACRQYSNAFASAKLVLGRRVVVGRDPEPVLEPESKAEEKAYGLLQTFAGGPQGQVELLDRMGTYFVVPGEMVLVGAYDPARTAESKFARWDVWSTTEVQWDGQKVHLQTEAMQDHWQEMPDYIKHVRVWNRHPRRGWEPDSPVLSSLDVLELVGLYDNRLQAEALSRLVGAGVWMIPQGMRLPTATGDPAGGSPADFLRLLMEVASLAVKDRRSAAAMVPILVEAAADDIAAAKDGHVSFSTPFDERIGDLQERAIRRWATGVDLPAETMLGLAEATHWNASLISEDKVQSFVIPSLRRAVGNITAGWLRPAQEQFDAVDPSLEVWFDPSGIKTRVDLAEETQWASDRFMVGEGDTKYGLGLSQTATPEGEELKRQVLLHLARMKPEYAGVVLRELGIDNGIPDPPKKKGSPSPSTISGDEGGGTAGRPGPQLDQALDAKPAASVPGRAAQLGTRRV